MFIKPTYNAKSIWDVAEGVMLYPADDDIACPWDADIIVEGDKVIIVGSLVGGTHSHYKTAGYCRCECSVDNFTKFYSLEVPDHLTDESTVSKLEEAGWIKI